MSHVAELIRTKEKAEGRADYWCQRMHTRCAEEGHRADPLHPNRCKWCGEIGVFRYEDREDQA